MESTTRPSTADALEVHLKYLREQGFRLTPQRQAVLELFCRLERHLTAPEVYAHLRDIDPGLSRATVYNTLDLFVQSGLLGRVVDTDGQTHYDPIATPHHHARCEFCNELIDVFIPEEQLNTLLESLGCAFAVDSAHLWLEGSCPKCTSQA